MNIRFYRAFSTEMMKIAAEIADSDIRKLLAERRGEEYLEGGGLLTNAISENFSTPTNAIMKSASYAASSYLPPDTYSVRGKKPTGKGSNYETASNYASSGLKGGMTGAGVYALKHNLHHGLEGGAPAMRRGHLGGAVALGSAVALTDRHLRHRAAKKALQELEKDAEGPALGWSPGTQNRANSSTGKFKNVIHKGTPLKFVKV